ncbi:MAG: TrmH family RNA methyltransferase, partial [Bacteroidales bacterium]
MYRKLRNDELGRLSTQEFKKSEKLKITVVLDNVRSQHNIGSAFRTADSFLIEKIILCGISATPPTAEIHKSALGAEFSVDWQYNKETLQAVED